jgi:hypothetical protein
MIGIIVTIGASQSIGTLSKRGINTAARGRQGAVCVILSRTAFIAFCCRSRGLVTVIARRGTGVHRIACIRTIISSSTIFAISISTIFTPGGTSVNILSITTHPPRIPRRHGEAYRQTRKYFFHCPNPPCSRRRLRRNKNRQGIWRSGTRKSIHDNATRNFRACPVI